MYRFVLQSNIARYAELLGAEDCQASKDLLRRQLAEWRRDLAVLDSGGHGVAPHNLSSVSSPVRSWDGFRQLYEGASTPTLLLHPAAGLHIVDLNDAYAMATGIDWRSSGGARLFDVFPDNPDNPAADGVSNLYQSLVTVSATGKAHAMAVQRYDIRVEGEFVERYWRPLNTPIFDEHGRLSYIVHQVHDVTADMVAGRPEAPRSRSWART